MKVQYRTALVEIDEWNIFATFNDGQVNQFYIPCIYDKPEYSDIAKKYGYDDINRYCIEHELAHHFIADNLAWKWSWSVHSSAGKASSDFPVSWPNHIEWEENLVNAFQAYYKANIEDEWGTLHLVFSGDRLDELKQQFAKLCKKVLDEGCDIRYNQGTITEI
jgi:hypothetical protein